MSNFQHQPFVKLVLPLIIGILIQYYLHFPFVLICIIGILFFFVFSSTIFIKSKSRTNLLSGVSLALLFVGLGMFTASLNDLSQSNKANISEQTYIAKVIDYPSDKSSLKRLNLQLISEYKGGIWLDSDVKVLAYLQPNEFKDSLESGSEIIFTSELKDINSPKNPFEFNYERYMAFKQVNQTVFLRSDQWRIFNQNKKGIRHKALNLRQSIVNRFYDCGIEGEQLAVFSALTLGYKSKLDAKLKSAYSGAGAMHVLAVSGMHVGIVYFVLLWFFGVFSFFRKKNRLKYVFVIVFIWGYALITGLSTSVLRSALMFSFLLLGSIIKQRSSVYNSLAASALVLLIFNPAFLFDVGFQLSYFAVTGIVFFYPKIYKVVDVKNKFIDIFWKLIVVSISAQISTFPIAVYYFNQFSSYFWLSNIVVSIAAVFLMYGALLLILLQPFAVVAKSVAWVISQIVAFTNFFVFEINDLPFAVIQGIQIQLFHVVLFYLVIAFFTLWIIKKKFKMLLFALALVCGIIAVGNIKLTYDLEEEILCVYHVPQGTAVQFIQNKDAYWIISGKKRIDSSFIETANAYWAINNNYILDKKDTARNNFLLKNNFFAFSDFKVLVINEELPISSLSYLDSIDIGIDFALVCGNPSLKYEDLPRDLRISNIIIDGSVPPWKAKNWQSKENVCIHQTSRSGAFVYASRQ